MKLHGETVRMAVCWTCRYFRTFLLAPHTNGLRDVPRCGALSSLQKSPPRGDSAEFSPGLKQNFVRFAGKIHYCGGAEESKGGDGDAAATVANAVKGGDGEAPVGAPNAYCCSR